MYSRGWVDPVPDPLLLLKSGSVGNRSRTSGSVDRNSDHYKTEAVHLDSWMIRYLKIYYIAIWIVAYVNNMQQATGLLPSSGGCLLQLVLPPDVVKSLIMDAEEVTMWTPSVTISAHSFTFLYLFKAQWSTCGCVPAALTYQNCAFCPQSVFVCSVWFSQ
jgi:hypothetical protein